MSLPLVKRPSFGDTCFFSDVRSVNGDSWLTCWLPFARWARKVDDDAWSWKNVKKRFQKIESYHVEIPAEHKKYINPKAEGTVFFPLPSVSPQQKHKN